MPGSSIGTLFKVTTFGESHGPAVGAIVQGVKPNIPLKAQDIQVELDRRKPGQSDITTPRKESDTVEILSGVFNGKTTGLPIGLLIRNKDVQSRDYIHLKNIFRPGHADFTYLKKYGIRDWRGSGRASGRETAVRVAAGAIATKCLSQRNIHITAYTLEVAGVRAKRIDLRKVESNPVRCPDSRQAVLMIKKIEEAKKKGDSVGGIIETVVRGCPVGLGDPVFDKLDARLAAAVMSIGAVKGIEFGSGFRVSGMRASQCNDPFIKKGQRIRTKTNHMGGILGGISTGEDILFRIAVKPPSSIGKEQVTVDVQGRTKKISIAGRHDPCLCPRIVPVVEAMTAITLLDSLLIQESIRK